MKQKDWFKYKGYLHLTNSISPSQRDKVFRYVSNSKNIIKHSFKPLILKELKSRRYKYSNFNGKKIRSHKKIVKGQLVSNKKIRTILYATHLDSHIYSYYAKIILGKFYNRELKTDKLLDKSVIAYRSIPTSDNISNKNNIHFAAEVFEEIKSRENCAAIVMDIENFFPSLNHKILKLAWAKILGLKSLPKDHYNIFKSVTNFSFIRQSELRVSSGGFDEKKLAELRKLGINSFFYNFDKFLGSGICIRKNQKINDNSERIGIPQGLPISAVLANIYMLNFDKRVIENLTKKYDIFYRRYSDDIILVGGIEQVHYIKDYISNLLLEIHLKVSMDKVEETIFRKLNDKIISHRIIQGKEIRNLPLNYLGFEFYGYQTLLKTKNLSKFYREMKSSVKRKNKKSDLSQKKVLEDEHFLYKRKIYRLYSFHGVKKRTIRKKVYINLYGHQKLISFQRKFRGNFIRYAYKAADIMDSPEIKRQVNNHWKILSRTISKYNFDNDKNIL